MRLETKIIRVTRIGDLHAARMQRIILARYVLSIVLSKGKILCAAAGCGAGFGLDEAKNPSAHSTANHIHLQIPLGPSSMGGGHGDLPKNTCNGNGNGCK
jgi:hypothetical protein